MVIPDWGSTQARAVEDVCRDDAAAVWVADQQDRAVGFVAIRVGDGEIHMPAVDPDHAPARRTYERAGFTAFPQVQYYKRLDG